MNLRRIGAVVTVAVVAMVACGKAAEVVAPGLAVRAAAKSTFDGDRARYTLSLVGDEADLAALFEPDEEDRRFLEVLRDSHLAVSVDGDRFAFEAKVGDAGRAVEVRMVDNVLYARADVAGLAELFDADPAALSQLVAGAGGAGLGFLGDAVAGRWLALDLTPLEQMAGGFGASGGSDAPAGPEGFSALLEAISDTFGSDVDVRRVGDEDAGEHYHLTVPIRRVYERLMPVLTSLAPFPGEAVPPAAGIPDQSLSLDLWVADDRIRRAELDLGQFAGPEGPAGRVVLRVDIAGVDGSIEAPGDAVPVDVTSLLGQLMAGFGAGFESGFEMIPGS